MEKITITARLRELGISEIKPTQEALIKMNISQRRLTTILDKKNKTPVTVCELQKISEWISNSNKIAEEDLVLLVK